MKKLKCILLIDDDPTANSLNHFIIKEMEVTECIDVVSDGLEGLHYLKNKPAPSLILLDLRMPVLDGFEFLEFFNKLQIEDKEKITIVVLSSSGRGDDIKRALELGAKNYLVKPVSEAKIKEIVKEYFKIEK